MSDDKTTYQATPVATLREQIMDSRIPKNEREWWAARTIEKLERELASANAKFKACALCSGPTLFQFNDVSMFQFNQMRDELAAAKKDTARLDWLDKHPVNPQRVYDLYNGLSYRAAIDGAMEFEGDK